MDINAIRTSITRALIIIHQDRVVQKVDNAIHRINQYPADSVVCFVNTYPLDSDLTGVKHYPAFEQPGSKFKKRTSKEQATVLFLASGNLPHLQRCMTVNDS